jgi:putative ABC transport system permease protein
MHLRDLFSSALQGLLTHKGRALLTMLGIIIGIASIMVVMSVGKGANYLVLSEIQSFGPDTVFVLPGRKPRGLNDISSTLLSDSLKVNDFKDLDDPAKLSHVVRVIPYVFSPVTMEYDAETFNGMLIGSTQDAQPSFELDIVEGRFFDLFDVSDHARVAVIGERVKEELFGLDSALDKKIRVNDTLFRVIGVMGPEGQSFVDIDSSIFAPYPPVQQDVLGIRHFQRIAVEASSQDVLPGVVSDVEALLRDNHNIDNPDNDDFSVQTQEDVAQTVGSVTSILTILLASVAAISLIVGGVGIMNVMFVSVTERTKEIGLRKALGARSKDILLQFLIESALLTLLGGVIGVLAGGGLTVLATVAANAFAGLSFPLLISWWGVMLGVVVSVGLGIVFGIVPARSAARKSPMEAIRY